MTDAQPLIDILTTCKNVLITTHVRPDGDALGSTAALSLGLRAKGIASEVLLLSALPPKYAFVHKDPGVISYDMDRGWPTAFDFDRFDALAVVDTGTWSQLPGMQERLANFTKPKLVIDHHLTQEDWATHHLVDKKASSAAEVVAMLLKQWGVPFDSQIANALYVGMTADTGWFQYSNTRPATLRLAAELMEIGVDTDRIYQALYQNDRPQRLAMQTKALQSLQLLAGGKLAVMTLTKQDYLDAGATNNDTDGLINIPLSVATVEVSLMLAEPLVDGPIRGSLRSKGGIDVAAFAQQFGGGGHARAAGVKFEGTLTDAVEKVAGELTRAITATPAAT
ncbi:MAG TPA: bifunctional oligoribonuclease/PAP phosphatase NrnA [Tepidisphaeraceae bacterium]|jgi:phosphoesterase RecJ-like protein|nr:bifunctional oligoribonuclease/PAP phosphatase NrnA [Tepidisphaeraceae bacterium]